VRTIAKLNDMKNLIFLSTALISISLAFSLLSFTTVSAEESNDVLHIYKEGKKSGKFGNLEINEPNISSYVIQSMDDELAVRIETAGSRNEYSVLAPIVKRNGNLFVNCVYKSIYDSVDGSRLAGSSCRWIPLEKFDPESAINDSGLLRYKSGSTSPHSE